MGLVLKAAGLVRKGGAAVPGLHAEEGRAGLGPEGGHGKVPEVQRNAPARGFVPQGDAPGAEPLENKGVQALENLIVQGDFPAAKHGLPPAAAEEALGSEEEGVRVLGMLEEQPVFLKPLSLTEGAEDGGMGPDAEGQGAGAGILHGEGGGKAVFQKLVPDLENEGKGIAGQGFGALPELQDGVVPALLHGGEPALPGEAVAGHLKDAAVHVHPAVLQAAHDGEENGVLPGPEGGAALPDVLGPGPVLEGGQLAAQGADGGGQGCVGEGDGHGAPPVVWI